MKTEKLTYGLTKLCLSAIFMVVVMQSIGCTVTPEEVIAEQERRRAMSSQMAWAYIASENQNNKVVSVLTGLFADPQLVKAVESANGDFEKELALAEKSQLPPGGVGGMLSSIRGNVGSALKKEEAFLQGGGSGLILLGEVTGPDDKALTGNSRGATEIERFMGDLLKLEGLEDKWYYISMTPADAEKKFGAAGASGGNAIQNSGRTYTYNRENILLLNLRVTSEPIKAQHLVRYTGTGSIAAPATRTSSGISGAKIEYYYQPFRGEWISESEELKLREKEKAARSAG